MTEGKKFEEDFKKSIPENCWFYRFKDGTASWERNEDNSFKADKTRFQAKNICDCQVFNGVNLFLLELKSTKSKSLPLSMVRANQIKELTTASKFSGIVAGFVVNFRSVNETYFITIDQFNRFVNEGSRKSIPLDYFFHKTIRIGQERKRVRMRYDLRNFFNKSLLF